MSDAQAEAAETQSRIRAIAVAAGLMTEQQAEKWIMVRAGEFGKGAFRGVATPDVCDHCGGKDHGWVPLEVGFSMEMPEATRFALIKLLPQGNGPAN